MDSQRFSDLSDEQVRLLNAECEAFKETIASDQLPRIEDHLASVSPELRDVLFRELLTIELEQRMMRGESPDSSEYSDRFPDDREKICRVFDRVSAALSQTNARLNVEKTGELQTSSLDEGAPRLVPGMPERGTIIRCLGSYGILRVLGQGGWGSCTRRDRSASIGLSR